MARQSGEDKYLCAYIVLKSSDRLLSRLPSAEIKQFLSMDLPEYMIPSYFVALGKIPLTPNGKINRKALPIPELKIGESYCAPGMNIEKQLVGIWSEVLGVKEGQSALK